MPVFVEGKRQLCGGGSHHLPAKEVALLLLLMKCYSRLAGLQASGQTR